VVCLVWVPGFCRPAWRVALITEGRRWLSAGCARYAPVTGGAVAPDEVIAGLRAANARLRELLAERDARIAGLEEQLDELRA
jgi:hypothetical protein